ncbi:MAG: DUF4256 domain-containing protein [Spirochaetes bacterium]|nr:DUF4256 domain-containing protein [Spirochaetota bacterium]
MKKATGGDLLEILKARFHSQPHLHKDMPWEKIEERIAHNPKALKALQNMEGSDGEPDVIGFDEARNEYLFCDCSAESPAARRSACYDQKALESRKENKPKCSAMERAKEMGIELLSEGQYRDLQKLAPFDLKTSSWVKTPDSIRKLGGALFCDRRYDHVFTYHNGADSYFASRGFRGILRV